MVCSNCKGVGHNYLTCPVLTIEQINIIKENNKKKAQEVSARRAQREENRLNRLRIQEERKNKKRKYEIINTMDHELTLYWSDNNIDFHRFTYISSHSTSSITCNKNKHRIIAIPFIEVSENGSLNAIKTITIGDIDDEIPYTTIFNMKMKDFEGTTIIFDEEYNPPQTDMEKWKEYGLKSFYLLKQIEMITGGTDEEGEVTKKEYENIDPFLEMLKEIKTPDNCTELDKEKAGIPSKLTNIT